MARQSITFTEPNDLWLKNQVDSKEFSNKSEVVNDLIRQARKKQEAIKSIKDALVQGEESGVSELTPREIMACVIERKRQNGEI